MESLHLLYDLGWLMVAASVASIVLRRLHQPAILGYLLAGLLLGGNLLPVSPLHETENIHALSELGVLFLMFYIGLEFDLGKLRPVVGASIMALVLQTALMGLTGIAVARILGWTTVEGFFLGGILSISSSMVTFKLIEERGELGRSYAQYAAGVLILEDILAIILLVVLAGVAVTGKLEVGDVTKTTFLVGMFVVVVFVIGKLIAPGVLKVLHRFGNNETITLFTVGLILGVSLLAARFQFSLALGGFMAGAILSRSSLAEEIESLTTPLRDFFSALFFVAVGTLIDPADILHHWAVIAVLSLLVIMGKFVSCWLGFALGGVPPPVATRAAFAKSQIGEFSFIIAALALSLGVTNPALKALASGVAMVTILLTPLARGAAEWVNASAEKCIPARARGALHHYQRWFETLRLALKESRFLQAARKSIVHIAVHFILLNALILLTSLAVTRIPMGDDPVWHQTEQRLLWGLAALVSIPIQVAILRSANVVAMVFGEIAFEWRVLRTISHGPLRDIVRWSLFSVVFVAYAAVFLAACAPYFPSGLSLLFFVVVCLVLAAVFWRRAVRVQSRMESSLLEALREHSGSAVKASVEEAIERISQRNPWPVKPIEVEVPRNARIAGRRIRDLNLRSVTGATIVAVQRGGIVHFDVSPDLPISPLDHVLLLGDTDQLNAAKGFLTDANPQPQPPAALPHQFEKVMVTATSELCGLALKDSNIRARFGVTIVGIQRGDVRLIGLKPDEILRDGDILLVMGRDADIGRLRDVLVGT